LLELSDLCVEVWKVLFALLRHRTAAIVKSLLRCNPLGFRVDLLCSRLLSNGLSSRKLSQLSLKFSNFPQSGFFCFPQFTGQSVDAGSDPSGEFRGSFFRSSRSRSGSLLSSLLSGLSFTTGCRRCVFRGCASVSGTSPVHNAGFIFRSGHVAFL
jgi:hypothetical protein